VKAFCPNGYVRSQEAIAEAMLVWSRDDLVKLRGRGKRTIKGASKAALAERPPQGCKPVDLLAWESGPKLKYHAQAERELEQMKLELEQIVASTENRLRNHLHGGEIKAYEFTTDGRREIEANFWATPEADGILERGNFLLVQAELDALLRGKPTFQRLQERLHEIQREGRLKKEAAEQQIRAEGLYRKDWFEEAWRNLPSDLKLRVGRPSKTSPKSSQKNRP
jgi:hypothetical protein